MSEQTSLLVTLRELESLIFKPEFRRDRAKLDAWAHPDFFEFAYSGRSYNRSEILELLPLDKSESKVWARDWSVLPLGESFALLTYKSAYETADGTLDRHSLRSSVWARTEQGWQLLFHQGTPTEAFEKAML